MTKNDKRLDAMKTLVRFAFSDDDGNAPKAAELLARVAILETERAAWDALMRYTLGHESRYVGVTSNEPPSLAIVEDGNSRDDQEECGATFGDAAVLLAERLGIFDRKTR